MAEKSKGIIRAAARITLVYVSGPLLGLLAFIAVNDGFEIRDDSIAALLWALIAYMVAHHVITALDAEVGGGSTREHLAAIRNEITDTAEGFRAYVRDMFKVSHVPPEEFNSRLSFSLGKAFHVKNTYIGLSVTNGLSSRRHSQICEYYKAVLTKSENATWEDIVGVGDFFEGRFEDLDADCSWGVIGKHRLRIVNASVPVLNFILLGNNEHSFSEVYFGWIPNSTNEAPMFHCSDPKIVTMFENYFESLKRTRDVLALPSISYRTSPQRRFSKEIIHRLRGDWLSISGAASYVPNSSTKSDANKGGLQAYAAISISYDHGWKIIGQVYSALDGSFMYSFESVMCVLLSNTLYYRYHNRGEYANIQAQGIGVYSLAVNQDTLRGYYVKETPQLLGGSRGDGSGKASALQAVKTIALEKLSHAERLEIISAKILGRNLDKRREDSPESLQDVIEGPLPASDFQPSGLQVD